MLCNFFYWNQELVYFCCYWEDSCMTRSVQTTEKYLKKVLNITAEIKVNCGFEQVNHCNFYFVTLLEFLVRRFSVRYQFSNCNILGTYLIDFPIVRYQPPLPPWKSWIRPSKLQLGRCNWFFFMLVLDVSKPSCASWIKTGVGYLLSSSWRKHVDTSVLTSNTDHLPSK